MRTPTRLALAAVALVAAACSYDVLSGPVHAQVTNIPTTATYLKVTLTDSALQAFSYEPHFAVGVNPSLDFQFKPTDPHPMQTGPFKLSVDSYDSAQNLLASGSANGNYVAEGQPTDTVVVALVPTGQQGTFGTPCIPDTSGGPNRCNPGLTCLQRSSSDKGVCTQSCDAASHPCPSSPQPQATCGVAGNAGAVCQWSCTKAADCPPTLVCGASGFCQANN